MLDFFFEKLDEYYEVKNPDATEKFLMQTVNKMRENGEDKAYEFVSVLNELASFYKGVSQYKDAERIYIEAIEILGNLGGGNTVGHAAIILNYAGLLRLMRQNNEAIRMFLEAKKLLEKQNLKKDYAYASVLNNLALVYQDIGNYVYAEEYSLHALELIRSGVGGDAELATSFNNLAAINYRMKNYDKGLKFIKEALKLYNKMKDKDIHVAAALSTQGAMQFALEDYEGAQTSYTESAEITRNYFGSNADFASTLRNLSTVEDKLGNIKNALYYAEQARKAMKRVHGARDDRTIECAAWEAELKSRLKSKK